MPDAERGRGPDHGKARKGTEARGRTGFPAEQPSATLGGPQFAIHGAGEALSVANALGTTSGGK